MFLIFTKGDCISSSNAISFLREDGQIFKEVNLDIGYLDNNHLMLLERISNKDLKKYLREKSRFFLEKNISLKDLSDEDTKKYFSSNLKEIGSLPIIVQLSYDGNPKNCMIGFSQKILTRWINDENINGAFVNINKIFGSEECCYLDIKDKIIKGFKKTEEENSEKVSLSSLYELKKRNNKNRGIEDPKLDDLQILKDDTYKLQKKYNDAINEINSNKHQSYLIDIDKNENKDSKDNYNIQEDNNFHDQLENSNENIFGDDFKQIDNTKEILNNNIDEDDIKINDIQNNEQKDSLNESTIIIDDNEYIFPVDDIETPLMIEEKEVDYSFDNLNNEHKEEIININNNVIHENATALNNTVETDITQKNIKDDDEFIKVDLEEINNKVNQENNININNSKTSDIDWVEKYVLNDNEIEHQKEVDYVSKK